MLEPFHRCPGKPEHTVLALRLGVSRDLKRRSLHVGHVGYGFHCFDNDRLPLRKSKAKDIVRFIERFGSSSPLSGKHSVTRWKVADQFRKR
ncbi:MAG: hypothetical protein DME21_10700 [Verrucomicrobia bacterium]|nr:MAG: hypothetical protein DME21_10700 [Verrucomicrobiota bacterium]